MTRVHLDRLPKPRLIAMIHDANQRAEQWRQTTARVLALTAPEKPRTLTPERTREDAEEILARLPLDPHADEHREVLWRETMPIQHGTNGGYKQHRRRGETACADCKAAAARYQASRKAVAA